MFANHVLSPGEVWLLVSWFVWGFLSTENNGLSQIRSTLMEVQVWTSQCT